MDVFRAVLLALKMSLIELAESRRQTNRARKCAGVFTKENCVPPQNMIPTIQAFTQNVTAELLQPTKLHSTNQLLTLLTSKYEKERFSAVRQLLNQHLTPELYAAVVSLAGSGNIDLQRCVASLIVKHSKEHSDIALLAVNVLSKQARTSSVPSKCLAIKTLAELHVTSVLFAILKDTIRDSHPWIRRCSVNALDRLVQDKIYHERVYSLLMERIQSESTVQVIGAYANIIKYYSNGPEFLPLVDKIWLKWGKMLMDVDADAQIAILDIFTIYARLNFTRPSSNLDVGEDVDEDSEELTEMLETSLNLLYSNCPAVILATIKMHLNLSTSPLHADKLARAALKVLGTNTFVPILAGPSAEDVVPFSRDVLIQDVLHCIKRMIGLGVGIPVFAKEWRSFLLHPIPFETKNARSLKLDLLALVANQENLHSIWNDMLAYLHQQVGGSTAERHDLIIMTLSILKWLIVKFASTEGWIENVGRELMSLLSNPDGKVIEQLVYVIRQIMFKKPSKNALLYLFNLIVSREREVRPMNASARATILGIIAEWVHLLPREAKECFRVCLKAFPDLSVRERRGLINLGMALLTYKRPASIDEAEEVGNGNVGNGNVETVETGTDDMRLRQMVDHLLTLLKFDQDYDLRDTARFLSALINSPFMQKEIFTQADIVTETAIESTFAIDSFSVFVNRQVDTFELPEWRSEERDAGLRRVDLPDDPWLNPKRYTPQSSSQISSSAQIVPLEYEKKEKKEKKDTKKRIVNLDVWFDSEASTEQTDDSESSESSEDVPVVQTKDKNVMEIVEEVVETTESEEESDEEEELLRENAW